MPFPQDSNLDDFDMNDALSQVSSGLSGDLGGGSTDPQPNDPPTGTPSGAAAPASAGSSQQPAGTSAQTATAGSPAAQNPVGAPAAPTPQAWESLPKAWKKDYEQHWSQLPPNIRQYVHERERQALEGIMHYKGHHDRFEQAYAPVKDYYAQAKIDPIQAFSNLAQADLALRYAPEDQKVQYLNKLLDDYGLRELAARVLGQPGQQGAAPSTPNPEIAQLRQQLTTLQQQQQQWLQSQEQAEIQQNLQAIEAFCGDSAHPYAEEVLSDMLALMQSGQATDLKSAYDTAIYINPSVRAKVLQAEMEKLNQRPGQPSKQPRSSNTPPASTAPKASSIDETLEEAYDKAMNR